MPLKWIHDEYRYSGKAVPRYNVNLSMIFRVEMETIQLTLVQIELFICGQKLDDLKGRTPKLRVEHLKQCLARAKCNEKEEKLANFKHILKDKANKLQWKRVH